MAAPRTQPYQFTNAICTWWLPEEAGDGDLPALLESLRQRGDAARAAGDLNWFRGQLELGKQSAADAAGGPHANPNAGRLHLQFCVGCETKATLRGWKQRISAIFGAAVGRDCHIEPARDAPAAWDYCGKDDTRVAGPIQVGERPPGRREAAARASREAAGRAQSRGAIFHHLIFVKRQRVEDIVKDPEVGPASTFHIAALLRAEGLREGAEGRRAADQRPCRLWFLHGATGSGKTRFAYCLAGGAGARGAVYCKDDRTHWWCGYRPSEHRVILFDEASDSSLRSSGVGISWFLRAGDQWGTTALPRRNLPSIELGSATTDIVVTTNLPIREVIPGSDEQWAALRRRGMEFGGGNVRFGARRPDGRSELFCEWAKFDDVVALLQPTMVAFDDAPGQGDHGAHPFRADLFELHGARAALARAQPPAAAAPGGGTQAAPSSEGAASEAISDGEPHSGGNSEAVSLPYLGLSSLDNLGYESESVHSSQQ